MIDRKTARAPGAMGIGQALQIIIRTKMTPEAYEKLEDKLAEFLRNEALDGFIEDEVTGNTTAFGQTAGDVAQDRRQDTVLYADRVTYSGFLENLSKSIEEFLTKQPRTREGHRILQSCDEMRGEMEFHLAAHPEDKHFIEAIKKALEEGDGTLELVLSG